MSRAYTAWVIQNGKGNDSLFVEIASNGKVVETPNVKKATQFARRSDARNLLRLFGDYRPDLDEFRPVEKTFG